MPLAREVVKDLAVEHGACVRPIQLRRTNLDTGEVDQVLVPCGHTLAHVCPSCAERARSLRAVQCREGWHLEDEPDLTPDPATEDQQWWVVLRADAQQTRDQAEAAGQDTADFDELIRELDEEIAKSGVRGSVAPDKPARRHRSTRRRQDAPDLPKRKVSPRTLGKTYTAPDGTTFRPSMFITLTCPSYCRVDHQGVPVDPARYDYDQAARDALAFAAALRRFGVPGEVLSDNGKQFTDRFGKGGEVLFDRICRDNGITHRLTQPRHPTTTGKIERFHGSLRRELLDDAVPFTDLAAAQTAIDAWVSEYNTTRPHQAIGMAAPAERFSTAAAQAEQDLLPLRLPAVLALATAPPASTLPAGPDDETPVPTAVRVSDGGPVEFERVVPASGNMQVARRQFWLGPDRSGLTVTFWASTGVIHLLIAGARIKTVRSHLAAADLTALAAQGARPAGPPPLPPAEPGAAIEADRIVSKDGAVHLAGRYVLAAEILGGRRGAGPDRGEHPDVLRP